jgi:hypothetical protein
VGTAFDFLRNKLGDSFGDNLLTNGEAEPGVTTGWTATGGATTVIGGVGIYGDYVFKLPSSGGKLVQTITPPYDANQLQVFGFFYAYEYLMQQPSNSIYMQVVLSYNENSTFDIYRLPINAAITDEYSGNYFDPTQVDVNYYIANKIITIPNNLTINEITVTMYNNSTLNMYCDDIAVRLSVGTSPTISAHTGTPIVDKYGIDPKYLEYFKNMVYNSSFEIFDTSTLEPTYWTGGASDPNSNFSGSYSLKLVASASSIQNDDGAIDPTWYESEATRVSFHSKSGQIKIEVYDVTNASYFTLTAENGTTGSSYTAGSNTNWQNSRDSVSFDPTEFGACTSLKIKFTNVHASQTGYVDDIMLAPDFTGKWPQLYKDGPKSNPAYLVDQNLSSELNIWTGTLTQYLAIASPDPETLYFCTEAEKAPAYTLRCILTVTGTVPTSTVINTNGNSSNITKSGDDVNLGASAAAFAEPAIFVTLNGAALVNGVEAVYVSATSFTLPTYTLDAGDIIILLG